eukprot:m.120455 g.120455  ORF g.120455 m.120455 type:complete len:713 (+) comp19582_c0_seq1:199-2337(+)
MSGLQCVVCRSVDFSQTEDTGMYVCLDCGTQSQDYREEVVDEAPIQGRKERRAAVKNNNVKLEQDNRLQFDSRFPFAAARAVLQGQSSAIVKLFSVPEQFQAMALQLYMLYAAKRASELMDLAALSQPTPSAPAETKPAVGSKKSSKKRKSSEENRADSPTAAEATEAAEAHDKRKQADSGEQPLPSPPSLRSAASAARLAGPAAEPPETARTVAGAAAAAVDVAAEQPAEEAGAEALPGAIPGSSAPLHQTDEPDSLPPVELSRQARVMFGRGPNCTVTLGICLLALRYMCSPILSVDLCRAIAHGTLPYTSAFAFVPRRVWEAMPLKEQAAFRPQNFARPAVIESLCNVVAAVLHLEPLPPLNSQSILRKWCIEMTFPAALAVCAERLLQLVPLASHLSLRVPLQKPTTMKPPPHVMLMAYFVLAVKLCYGLDDDAEHTYASLTNYKRSKHAAHLAPSLPPHYSNGGYMCLAVWASLRQRMDDLMAADASWCTDSAYIDLAAVSLRRELDPKSARHPAERLSTFAPTFDRLAQRSSSRSSSDNSSGSLRSVSTSSQPVFGESVDSTDEAEEAPQESRDGQHRQAPKPAVKAAIPVYVGKSRLCQIDLPAAHCVTYKNSEADQHSSYAFLIGFLSKYLMCSASQLHKATMTLQTRVIQAQEALDSEELQAKYRRSKANTCCTCGRSYTSVSSLYAHRRTKHPTEDYKSKAL